MDLPAKTHLFEQIHEILWEKIRSGEIVPGQRLKDVEWAQRLNVSRTPVREAMRKMQQEGILLPLAQGGYEVKPVSRADLVHLYRCRAAMEALAVEDAASRFDAAELARFESIMQQCDEAIAAGDLDRAFKLNSDFHKALIELSDNGHLKAQCATLQRMILFYRSALLTQVKSNTADRADYLDRLRVKQARHRDIIDALRAREGVKAARLMEGHVRETVEDLLPAVAETPARDETSEDAA